MPDVDGGTSGEGWFDVSWNKEEGGCIGRKGEGCEGGLGGEIFTEFSLVGSDWFGRRRFGI